MKKLFVIIHTYKYGEEIYVFKSYFDFNNKEQEGFSEAVKQLIDFMGIPFEEEENEVLSIHKVDEAAVQFEPKL